MNTRWILAGGVFAALAGCSLTVGFDGFAGDGGRDAATEDSPASVDTGTDAADADADAEAGSTDPNVAPLFVDAGNFCSGQDAATFCEDFDRQDSVARWLSEGPLARLTSYSSRSQPNNFALLAPEDPKVGNFAAKMTHTLQVASTNMEVSFDLFAEKVSPSNFLIAFALEYLGKSSARYSLRLVFPPQGGGQARLEESDLKLPDNDDILHPRFAVPTGKWMNVKLDVVLSGGTPSGQVYIDGSSVSGPVTLTPTVGLDPTPTIIVGAAFAGSPHTGWVLRYDNVIVKYR